jgi:hypothetical protein
MSRSWIVLLFLYFTVVACMDATASVPETVSVAPQAVEAFAVASPEVPEVEFSEPDPWDPYADAKLRCEPPKVLCETSKDCQGVYHPSNKRLKCVKAYWGDKICSPGWSNRAERRWRRDRLETLVAEAYFDGKQSRKATDLSKFLWLVYMRETTGRPWKRHRLNGDIHFAKQAWYRQRYRYGWEVGLDKFGEPKWMLPCKDAPERSKESRSFKRCREREPSMAYKKRSRWAFGLGPYGQNAALWTMAWDRQAPPEILCGEVESTETYLRGARRVWRKLRGGIQCGGKLYQPTVTWEILHRAIAGGKLCPGKKPSAGFRRRAERYGLNPQGRVSLSMLGTPIEREEQNVRALALRSYLDGVLPVPGL